MDASQRREREGETAKASEPARCTLPWWSWVAPLVLFHLGTQCSLLFRFTPGLSLFYLPLPLALALVQIWGIRVLPAFYLNALLSAPLWGLARWQLAPVYALPEALGVLASWLCFARVARGKPWLPNLSEMVSFLLLGVVVPIVVNVGLSHFLLVALGDLPFEKSVSSSLSMASADLLAVVAISLPLLLCHELFERCGLAVRRGGPRVSFPRLQASWAQSALFVFCLAATAAVSLWTGLHQQWAVYGLFPFVCAVWVGISAVVVMNSWLVIFSLVLPILTHVRHSPAAELASVSSGLAQFQLAIICISALLTARAILDAKEEAAERERMMEELAVSKDAAEASNRLKSTFLANMSHEIRTPMNAVIGFADLLASPRIPLEKRDKFIDLIRKNAMHLLSIIDEILEISRIEAGQMKPCLQPVEARTLFSEIYETFSATRNVADVEFLCDFPAEVQLQTDALKLRQVLNNLLVNAFKFTQRGYVKIGYRVNDGRLRAWVEDTGIGIPKEHHGTIFERFGRVEGDVSIKKGGLGLGLAISKAYVEMLGGSMSLESEPGRGATFSFVLPLTRGP